MAATYHRGHLSHESISLKYQKRLIYRDRNQTGSCQGLVKVGREVPAQIDRVYFQELNTVDSYAIL